jgi:2-dehydro-3-deoxy-D-arabinonate dehydratase
MLADSCIETGICRVAIDDRVQAAYVSEGSYYPLGHQLHELLSLSVGHLSELIRRSRKTGARHSDAIQVLPVVDVQEIWAAGVTYERSRRARHEEAASSDIYDAVYEADRPELFLKATANRVPGPGAPLRIRADSSWNVPEILISGAF